MALDLLLWLCLSINAVTLICSFIILKRFKKITKLTTLIYDQLAVSKTDLSSFEESEKFQKARFEDQLSYNANKIDHESFQNNLHQVTDPLLEPHRTTFSDNLKTATKAESHLIKVLQGKYAGHDEESFPPTGK
jgi:hypothetical protein